MDATLPGIYWCMNNPVRQHYLPVSYLKHFSDPDVLRRTNKHIVYIYEQAKPVRASTPQSEACERHLYTLSAPAADPFEIEKYLSKIEAAAALVITKAQSPDYAFDQDDKEVFAQYISLMFTRTPALMEYERDVSGPTARAMLKVLATDYPAAFAEEWDAYVHDEEDAPSAEYARQRILAGVLDGEEHPNTSLASMLYTARMSAEIIEKFQWQVLHTSDDEYFVTSDFPIIGAERYSANQMRLGVGFNTPNSEFYFPLSSRSCLRMAADIDSDAGYLTARNVRIVNEMEMRQAHRRIYSSVNSDKIRKKFDSQFGAIRLGKNALVPAWDGQSRPKL